MRRLVVTVFVLALLLGTTAAFALTEALKLERSPVTTPRFDRVFSPTCACPQSTARLSIRLRTAATIDAVIVDADGAPVRTLASESRRMAGRLVFRWDGENDAGSVVADGPYRLRLHFEEERWTIEIPNVVRVDTEPPTVELLGLAPRTLSPDGDGRRDRAQIDFRLSERARPLVLLDGLVAARGRARSGTAALVWRGTTERQPLPAGRYVVALQARDLAGNVSAPTAGIPVRIRYIRLATATLKTRRGGSLRFRVLTDVERFRWGLVRRGDNRRPLLAGTAGTSVVVVRLPPRIRAGRYVLRVAAGDHADETTVVVRARRR